METRKAMGIGLVLAIVVIAVIWLGTGGAGIAQPTATGSLCDKTFAITQHPSIIRGGEGMPFTLVANKTLPVWSGAPDQRRALVTIECNRTSTGGIRVFWDHPFNKFSDSAGKYINVGPGQSTTIFAENVWLFGFGPSAGTGWYSLSMDVSQ